MAAPKRPTHVVTNSNLYLMVGGKLCEQKAGTQLTLTTKQAEVMVSRGMIRSLKDDSVVEPDGTDEAS